MSLRIKSAIAALLVPMALVVSACGPQVVECDEDGVICTDNGGGYDNDREYDDDDEGWGEDDD